MFYTMKIQDAIWQKWSGGANCRDSQDHGTVSKYFFIAGALFLTAFGQLIIRARALAVAHAASGRAGYLIAMLLDPWVWVGLCGAVLAAVCWILTLRQLSVSTAYPFMALSFVIVPTGALVFLGEHVTALQWLGCCVIVAGVAVTAFGAPH
jgi:drug/metabolite transporter (DMT)-like permease